MALTEYGFAGKVRSRERVALAFSDVLDGEKRPLGASRVVLLVDPIDEAWAQEVRRCRATPEHQRTGLLVVASRPTYLGVRRWRQRPRAGNYLASGYIGGGASLQELIDAVRRCARGPEDGGVWPDGPVHPAAQAQTLDGALAAEIRGDPRVHEMLVMTCRSASRKEIADRFGIKEESLTDRMTNMRRRFGVSNAMALGVRISELGLLEDLPADLAPEQPAGTPAARDTRTSFVVDADGIEVEALDETVSHAVLARRYADRRGQDPRGMDLVSGAVEARAGDGFAGLGRTAFDADRASIERHVREAFSDRFTGELVVRFGD